MMIEQKFWGTTGERIRNARLAIGLSSQEELRKALALEGVNVSISAISQLETNDNRPSLPMLIALRKVLGKSIDWLLCVPEDVPKDVPEDVYTPAASEIAAMVDSLPLDIKPSVATEVKQLLKERYDAFDRTRRYNELMTLISERGGPDILDSAKRIISKESNIIVRKGIGDGLQ